MENKDIERSIIKKYRSTSKRESGMDKNNSTNNTEIHIC